MILDEPSSKLDPATERLVHRALGRLLAGRTAVIIAHRLTTLDRVDRIVVLDHGRVVEDGDRVSLLADERSHFAGLLAAGAAAGVAR